MSEQKFYKYFNIPKGVQYMISEYLLPKAEMDEIHKIIPAYVTAITTKKLRKVAASIVDINVAMIEYKKYTGRDANKENIKMLCPGDMDVLNKYYHLLGNNEALEHKCTSECMRKTNNGQITCVFIRYMYLPMNELTSLMKYEMTHALLDHVGEKWLNIS